ncbi:rab gdp/gtp exchange factor [Anaeramoeba flamelloides]|uniref:Rab gdp/gtp exchange factor n=1 Tax=Anaeramoeba flamelloides TaxID=1746091 RepID=A0ABQ8Y0B1_9EUKA|nr:rab gdp/gtp exchange factor [Anaeramoeba flamelloides]
MSTKQDNPPKNQKKQKNNKHTSEQELLYLQKLLKREKTSFDSERISLENVQKEMKVLIKQLQISVVESMNMNKIMVNLNSSKIDYLLRSPEELNQWQVKFSQPNDRSAPMSIKIQYQKMLRQLLYNLDFFIEAITTTATLISQTEMDILTHSSIFALFGNLCNDWEEKAFLNFLLSLIENEFQENTKSKILLSRNLILAKILSSYTKVTNTYHFIVSALREPILHVIQEPSLNLNEKDEEKLEGNIKKLIYLSREFIDLLNKKVPLLPSGLRYFTKKLKELCIKYGRKEDQELIIGDFLFLRFLNPIILTPERYGIIPDFPIHDTDRFNLSQIAKILLSLSHGSSLLRTSNKLFHRKLFNKKLSVTHLFNNIANFSDKGYSKANIKHFGKEVLINETPRSKNLIISLQDLTVIHKILYSHITQILEQRPIDNKEILQSNFVQFIKSLGKPILMVENEFENKYFSFSLNFILPPPPKIIRKKKRKVKVKRSQTVGMSIIKKKEINKVMNNKNKKIIRKRRKTVKKRPNLNKKELKVVRIKKKKNITIDSTEKKEEKKSNDEKEMNGKNEKEKEKEKEKGKERVIEIERGEEKETGREREKEKYVETEKEREKKKKKKMEGEREIEQEKKENKQKNDNYKESGDESDENESDDEYIKENYQWLDVRGKDYELKIDAIKKKMEKKVSVGNLNKAFPSQNDKIMKEAERKLRRALIDMGPINLYSSNGRSKIKFLDLLKRERDKAKSTKSVNMACSLDSTIKTLELLPRSVKLSEFRPLIWKLKKENQFRCKKLTFLIHKKYDYQNGVNHLKLKMNQTKEKMKCFETFIQSLLSIRLIEKKKKQITDYQNNLKGIENEKELSRNVNQIFKKIHHWVKNDTLSKVYKDNYKNIIQIIENYFFLHSFDYLFYPTFLKQSYLKEDENFSMKIFDIYKNLNPQFLNIPEKLWGKEIWILAINQLSSLNKFKTPLLKIECLSKCANIVNNIIRFSGQREFGADQVLPIIIYILIISNPPNFPSNMKYISCFADPYLIETEIEYWFTMLKSAFTYLNNLKDSELPQKIISYEKLDIWEKN